MEQVDTSSESMARIITSLGIDRSVANVLVRYFRINTPVDLGFFCAEMLGCSPHGIHPSDYNLSLVEVGLTATDLSRLVGCYLHFVSLCKHMTVNESLAWWFEHQCGDDALRLSIRAVDFQATAALPDGTTHSPPMINRQMVVQLLGDQAWQACKDCYEMNFLSGKIREVLVPHCNSIGYGVLPDRSAVYRELFDGVVVI